MYKLFYAILLSLVQPVFLAICQLILIKGGYTHPLLYKLLEFLITAGLVSCSWCTPQRSFQTKVSQCQFNNGTFVFCTPVGRIKRNVERVQNIYFCPLEFSVYFWDKPISFMFTYLLNVSFASDVFFFDSLWNESYFKSEFFFKVLLVNLVM